MAGAAWVLAALVVIVAVAFLFAPRREIATEIYIEASPARVWNALADMAAYGEWNPFIVAADGRFAEGEKIVITLNPQGGKAMTFRPTLLSVLPERELRWLGRLGAPRLFDGEHYFLLTPEGEGTRLTHGETFAGVLLWAMNVERFREDFMAMNAALKRRVEGESGPAAA